MNLFDSVLLFLCAFGAGLRRHDAPAVSALLLVTCALVVITSAVRR